MLIIGLLRWRKREDELRLEKSKEEALRSRDMWGASTEIRGGVRRRH